MAVEGSLKRLADAMRVATEFWDWKGNHVSVDADVIVDVLAAMDIDASTEESAQKALEEVQLRPWRQTLPPVIVARQGQGEEVRGSPVARSRCATQDFSRARWRAWRSAGG